MYCRIIRVLFALAILPVLQATPPEALALTPSAPTWFVVTPIDGDRQLAYLLPLTDADQIAHARQLISDGPGAAGGIISARIAAGADGYNRNMLDPNLPLWSWHVESVEGFGDFTIELCDGNPQLVEDDVDGWIANTDSAICFWGYTVSEELAEAPGYGLHKRSEGAWFNPDTPGQGLFFDVVDEGRSLFVGWFTFAIEDDGTGEPAHRWLTAFGPIVGSRAELELTVTRGGAFDSPAPVQPSPPGSVGTLVIELDTCDFGTARYEFVTGLTGSFAIVPVQPDAACLP
ncbi:MAG: hypothetical protein AAGA23_19835 [Pseudomonadota bacterium]